MKQVRRLDYTELKNSQFPSDFSFKTTAELEALQDIIGQERAVKAFEFGLAMKKKGYNIYMAGPSGTGKTTYAKSCVHKQAESEAVPLDWCYVYNFEHPKNPIALSFEAGMGTQFRKDMDDLIPLVQTELQKAFGADDYEMKRNAILRNLDETQDVLVGEMNAIAESYDFQIRKTSNGIFVIPIINGKAIEENEYQTLTEEQMNQIDKNSLLLQEKTNSLLREMNEYEKQCQKQLEELEYKVGLLAIGDDIQRMKAKYTNYERVLQYFDGVQEDILNHIDAFMEEEESEEEALAALLPMLNKKSKEDVTLKYKVNLVVEHGNTKGAPVVVSFNPTYRNLVGEIEYDSEYGNLNTDFMKIKGGLFHQANGGYLIVQAYDVLSSDHAWEALRRVIKTRQIHMEPTHEATTAAVAPTLKPEPIPADLKIIMIGNGYYYDMLSECDEEFDKFFKIRADFDYEMERSEENLWKIAKFIKSYVESEQGLEYDFDAVCAIIEYSSRTVERQDKLSTRFNHLAEILGESETWARLEQAEVVTGEHVRKTIFEKELRMKLYEDKLNAMLAEDMIMIDTQGAEIGQINGLAVLDMGNYCFGTPTRITATTYVGKSGIVNIEKEARMSGHTHDKGVQIITGFLGQTYAQNFPMSLSCRVCFEQNYNGIDGDSASSTELYAIISSLAELPIRQDLAVTGSVNQKGEIQAIGGVTYKIEGFYDLCKKRGLTGTQGVVIPVANVKELVLKEELIEAVKQGMFHIYPIAHIEEGLELLLSCDVGEKDVHGTYSKESIHGKVMDKLKRFHEASKGAC